VLMSISGILPNTGKGPRLRMFATFRDLKYEKKRKIRRLGIGLAMEGVKVLLVDLDPQGSLTASLGYKEPDSIEWKKSKGIVSSIEKNL